MADTSLDLGFSEEELHLLLQNLDRLSEAEVVAITVQLEELERRKRLDAARDDLIEFCKYMDPNYMVGRHHRILADQLMAIERGPLAPDGEDRICVNMPPRHGKSQLVSIYFPAWFLGRNPDKKVMMVSHTTDLAVDFGRKVRNLLAEDAYHNLFPHVSLATDSKSAGRWNTNFGGEYFACISPDTTVRTMRGVVTAETVVPGDKIATASGFVPVYATMRTSHDETIHVAGGKYSTEHPIWTLNRGWVEAGSISSTDVLCAENIWGILKSYLWRIKDAYLEYAYVSALVQHQGALPARKEPQVHKLWGAGNYARRSMGKLQRIFGRYGASPVYGPHNWQDRQQWALQPRELSLGGQIPAAEQQAHQCTYRDSNPCATRTIIGFDSRGVAVSDFTRDGCAEPKETTQSKHEHSRAPNDIGWVRSSFAWFLAGGRASTRYDRCQAGIKSYLARLPEAAQQLCGILLGVRYAGVILRESHKAREFINFRVGGSNTFFSAGVLTHNCGIGSSIAGRGADLLLVDDPHSEQDVINGNFEVFQKAYEWFTFGARTRLMPGGRIAIIATRWHLDDLTGRVTRDMIKNEGADQYNIIEFPAILDVEVTEPDEDGEEVTHIVQKPLWPEFFDMAALLRTKASMPVFQWNSQYQQQPTAEEAAIVKREWWMRWEDEKPPECDYIIMSLDSAAETKTRNDFTALTVWGVFYNEEVSNHNIILLEAIKDRYEFPELKQMALEQYKIWEPDSFIVEKKSSGVALYQEMRRMGLPVQEYTPHRGTGDKMARLNSVADIISSGLVWAPETRWAEEVIEEIAGFPFASHDDLVDSSVMALMRFRQGGFVKLPSDYKDEDAMYMMGQKKADYY